MAAADKDKGEESEYTYTDEEDEAAEPGEPEPTPPPTGPGGARTPARRSAKVTIAAAASTDVAAKRDSPCRDSSSDRGPRARSLQSPRRGRDRERQRRSRSRRRDGGAERERGAGATGVPEPLHPPPPPPSGTKGKGKSRSQYCPHCWAKVKTGGGRAGLSQHMWSNERCLAWQQYGDGTRCSCMGRSLGQGAYPEAEAGAGDARRGWSAGHCPCPLLEAPPFQGGGGSPG